MESQGPSSPDSPRTPDLPPARGRRVQNHPLYQTPQQSSSANHLQGSRSSVPSPRTPQTPQTLQTSQTSQTSQTLQTSQTSQPEPPSSSKSKLRSFSWRSSKNPLAVTPDKAVKAAIPPEKPVKPVREERPPIRPVKPRKKKYKISKEADGLQDKANPNLALMEAEPCDMANGETSEWSNIRTLVHLDRSGRVIDNPDLSNPTRPRTTRALELVLEWETKAARTRSEYNTITPGDTESMIKWNRRNSYFAPSGQRRFDVRRTYNDRPPTFRPETTAFDLGGRSSIYEGLRPGNTQQLPFMNGAPTYGPPRRYRQPGLTSSRSASGSLVHYGTSVYGLPLRDRSYETVTSVAATGSSSPGAGYQTDPTSDSSSVYRPSPGRGFSPVKSKRERIVLPPAPEEESKKSKKRQASSQANPPQKLKSWLARRFSRS